MRKRRFLKLMAGVCLAAVLLSVSACGSKEKEETENPLEAGAYDAEGNFLQLAWYPDAKMNDIDDARWGKNEDGFLVYEGKGYKSYVAIDVSSNQEVIDWEKVKAAGVDYAIMRAGYRTYGSGIIKTDECCYWNLKEAKKAGVKTGVYFFSQAVNKREAEEEAQFVLDMIGTFKLDLPVYYDTEEITYDTARTDDLTGKQLTDNAVAFCEYIKKAGYEPGIYANQMWLCNQLDLLRLEDYGIWLAKYAEELNYPYEIEAWQYSSEGHVDGIGPAVDLDVILVRK